MMKIKPRRSGSLCRRCLPITCAAAVALLVGASTVLADGSSGWDEYPEGFLPKTVYSGNIAAYDARTFYFDPPTVFAVDDPWRFIDENPDMAQYHSPPNVFQTAGYIGGGGWLVTRLATMGLTTGQVETDARVNLFYYEADPEFIGTTIILEASRRGQVVADDRVTITEYRKIVLQREFIISGVEFDTLRVRCTREDYPPIAGALLAIDNLEITGGGLPSDLEIEAPVPALAGAENTLTARWHTPGDRIYFAWGTEVGAVNVPRCQGLVADLKNAQMIDSAIVGADGIASISFMAPVAALDRSIWFQAFEIGSCTKSRFAPVTFE
ncbi:MAG: hypothetical protein D8M59_10475 [Planctomycetes bacterium]|nr:hypothetical protein [Planctomycetota bacterium]NOG55268.1 hypothetical protein [Planctomycetota bacterium]